MTVIFSSRTILDPSYRPFPQHAHLTFNEMQMRFIGDFAMPTSGKVSVKSAVKSLLAQEHKLKRSVSKLTYVPFLLAVLLFLPRSIELKLSHQ